MSHHRVGRGPDFYLSDIGPCPYLAGESERKLFTPLIGRDAAALYDRLGAAGFRRSQTIAYRPACPNCRACVSVRVGVRGFTPRRRHRRAERANRDLEGVIVDNLATEEQYDLFRRYVAARHGEGGMADMGLFDYAAMVEETTTRTAIVEYREPAAPGDGPREGRLIAATLTDIVEDGLSMAYSFFDPREAKRSLGLYMILDHITKARRVGLAHVYLGYWIRGAPKMAYKAELPALEGFDGEAWRRVAPGG